MKLEFSTVEKPILKSKLIRRYTLLIKGGHSLEDEYKSFIINSYTNEELVKKILSEGNNQQRIEIYQSYKTWYIFLWLLSPVILCFIAAIIMSSINIPEALTRFINFYLISFVALFGAVIYYIILSRSGGPTKVETIYFVDVINGKPIFFDLKKVILS